MLNHNYLSISDSIFRCIFMDVIKIIVLYLLVLNVLGFAFMGIDKLQAIHHAWRISEATLLITAFIGGSLGSFLAMHIFRHKTKHWYFRFGLPLILTLHIIIIAYVVGAKHIVIM